LNFTDFGGGITTPKRSPENHKKRNEKRKRERRTKQDRKRTLKSQKTKEIQSLNAKNISLFESEKKAPKKGVAEPRQKFKMLSAKCG